MQTWLFFTLITFGSLAQAVDITLPSINSDLQDVSCQIRRVIKNPSTGQIEDQPHGSGTFIKNNLFLTAAHCVTGFYYPFQTQEFLKTYLACPGGRTVAVKNWIIHPEFFNPAVFDTQHQVNYPFSLDGQDTYAHSDMAVLITEPTSEVTNLKLVSTHEQEKQLLQSKSCRLLGYSPHVCDEKTGDSCHRSVNVAINRPASDFLTVDNSEDFKGGDSGSGVVCNSGKERFLTGVYRSRMHWQEGLSVAAKNSFLTELFTLDESALLDRASAIQYSPKFNSTAVLLFRIQAAVDTLTQTRMHLNLKVAVSAGESSLTALQAFIEKQPRTLSHWADKNITTITISELEKPFSFVGTTLYVSPSISVDELSKIP